jgi:mannose-6-phosphate isomerase-like protein (cupin superfamily)
VGYIVAGTVKMMILDEPTLTLNAGDGFLINPRVPHNALDIGPDTGQMLSTYIVEIGEPLATFVDGPPTTD